MLFDIRGGGRRRTIQAIYLTLAILMGAGLVLFGIGGSVSGGLVDAFDQGGGDANSALEKQVERAEQRVRTRPRDEKAWADLGRLRYTQASAGDNYDAETQQFTKDGKEALGKVAEAWKRYLALDPKKPDDGFAALMVQAYGPAGLNQPAEAVKAQEVVTEAQPSANTFGQLAFFAYAAGDLRKGDLAADRAVELAPKEERAQVRQEMKRAKTEALQPVPGSGQDAPQAGG